MMCCRAEGSQLEEDNMRINSEIEAQKAAVEDAKAQLQYYRQHQHDANQKVYHSQLTIFSLAQLYLSSRCRSVVKL